LNIYVALFRGINVGGHNKLPMTGRNWNTVRKLQEMIIG